MTSEKALICEKDLDFGAEIPLYAQLAKILNQKIERQELKIGDQLPTEMSLCEKLGLSRSTVRRALAMLERQGLIVRKPRRGTMVCKPKLHRSLNTMYNFSREMAGMGLIPSSRVLRFEQTRPDEAIAEQLGIGEEESVYKITRLRMANGRPILLETAYIPTRFCENLSRETLNDSLYATISERTNAQPKEATEVYEVLTLREREAELLECPAGTPAFRIMRTSSNTNGDIFECTIILAPGDRNRYEITLHRDNISYKQTI